MNRREFLKAAPCSTLALAAIPAIPVAAAPSRMIPPGEDTWFCTCDPAAIPWLHKPFDPAADLHAIRGNSACLSHAGSLIASIELEHRTDYWLFIRNLVFVADRCRLLRDSIFDVAYAPVWGKLDVRQDRRTKDLGIVLSRGGAQTIAYSICNMQDILDDPAIPYVRIRWSFTVPREATEGTIWHW